MSAIGPTGDDPIFEDDYQKARRRRMRAAGLTVDLGPTKVRGTFGRGHHVAAVGTPKDAQGEPPEPETRADDERSRGTLILASDTPSVEAMRLWARAEVQPRQRVSRLEEAVAFLKQELSDGPISARAIYERGAREGLSERTIDRAKREARIGSQRFQTDGGMAWFWCLPRTEPSSLDPCVL